MIVVVWVGYSAAVCYCLLVVADRLVVCVYGWFDGSWLLVMVVVDCFDV